MAIEESLYEARRIEECEEYLYGITNREIDEYIKSENLKSRDKLRR